MIPMGCIVKKDGIMYPVNPALVEREIKGYRGAKYIGDIYTTEQLLQLLRDRSK